MATLRNDGWLNAVTRAANTYFDELLRPCPDGFRQLRIHDCRHTVGQRLRSVGASELDIATLLGHATRSVTAHYAQAEVLTLLAHLEGIAAPREGSTSVTLSALHCRQVA